MQGTRALGTFLRDLRHSRGGLRLRHFILVLLLAVPLAADPLTEVRSSLARFTGRAPIRATYEVQQSVLSEGKFGNDKYDGKATVELEGDAEGVRVVYSRTLLDQVEREESAKSRDPKQETPTVSALRQVDPVDTADVLDFAPVLLRTLDGAKVVTDQAGTWAGKPARVIVFRLADKLDDDDAGKVKFAQNRLTLWLGPELVPLAAERVVEMKISFLIFKAESKQKKSWHFAQVGDRLVRVRLESSESNSGMGQKGNEQLVATAKVR